MSEYTEFLTHLAKGNPRSFALFANKQGVLDDTIRFFHKEQIEWLKDPNTIKDLVDKLKDTEDDYMHYAVSNNAVMRSALIHASFTNWWSNKCDGFLDLSKYEQYKLEYEEYLKQRELHRAGKGPDPDMDKFLPYPKKPTPELIQEVREHFKGVGVGYLFDEDYYTGLNTSRPAQEMQSASESAKGEVTETSKSVDGKSTVTSTPVAKEVEVTPSHTDRKPVEKKDEVASKPVEKKSNHNKAAPIAGVVEKNAVPAPTSVERTELKSKDTTVQIKLDSMYSGTRYTQPYKDLTAYLDRYAQEGDLSKLSVDKGDLEKFIWNLDRVTALLVSIKIEAKELLNKL